MYFFSLASFSPYAKSKNECKAHQIHGRFGRFALPLIQFLEGWKWNPAMYWALDCGRRAGDRRWTAERPPPPPLDRAATNVGCPGKLPPIWGGPRARPPMWGGARVRSPARKRRGRGHRRGGGGANWLPVLGEAAVAIACCSAGERRCEGPGGGWAAGACCSAGGAEVHGDEPRTWASAGAGRGPGRRRRRGDGMENFRVRPRGWVGGVVIFWKFRGHCCSRMLFGG